MRAEETYPKSKLEWALFHARAGWFVFPLKPGHASDSRLAKQPAVNAWQRAATRDEATIRTWWTQDANFNIGGACGRSGFTAFDADRHGAVDGIASLAALEADLGKLPETWRSTTPSGSAHIVFRHADGPTNAGVLGQGLDLRGGPRDPDGKGHGYIVLPGSDNPAVGRYELDPLCDGVTFADLPVAWAAAIKAPRARREATGAVEIDSERAIARAVAEIADAIEANDVAVEGEGGNDRTYRLFARLRDLGVSMEAALEIAEPWNDACAPPWDADEFARVAEHAYQYAQNAPGAYANEQTLDEALATISPEDLSVATKGTTGEKTKRRYAFLDGYQQDELPDPDWLVSDLIMKRSTVLVYGKTASFKTFIVLDLCLSLCAGLSPLGFSAANRPHCAVFLEAEGVAGISKKRKPAWAAARGLDRDAYRGLKFYIAGQVPLSAEGLKAADILCAELKEAGIAPDVVTVDTVAKAMAGADENSSADAGIIVAIADRIKETLGCAVIMIHHSGKDGERGARGSSALEAGFDTVLKIESTAGKAASTATVTTVKQKEAEPCSPVHLRAVQAHGSLVFDRITADQHAALNAPADELGSEVVAQTIRDLAASMNGQSVTTTILATELMRSWGDDPTPAATRALSSRLRRRAKAGGPLAGLVATREPLTWTSTEVDENV